MSRGTPQGSIKNATKISNLPIELHFILNVVDEWPPVAVEGVPCIQVEGGYRIETPPLFVKGLSVGDVISAEFNSDGNVASLQLISRSGRTTLWILRTAEGDNIESVLPRLQSMNCKIVALPKQGSYSVDVPAEVSIADVDACLAQLDANSTAVAFPSFRHDREWHA
jgi:hypothetical protein